jgi:hypothetical protein
VNTPRIIMKAAKFIFLIIDWIGLVARF